MTKACHQKSRLSSSTSISTLFAIIVRRLEPSYLAAPAGGVPTRSCCLFRRPHNETSCRFSVHCADTQPTWPSVPDPAGFFAGLAFLARGRQSAPRLDAGRMQHFLELAVV